MDEVKVWILTAAIALTGGILGWVVNRAVSMILSALQNIRLELVKLNDNIVKQEQQIGFLQDAQRDHEQRLRHLEQK